MEDLITNETIRVITKTFRFDDSIKQFYYSLRDISNLLIDLKVIKRPGWKFYKNCIIDALYSLKTRLNGEPFNHDVIVLDHNDYFIGRTILCDNLKKYKNNFYIDKIIKYFL